MNAGVDVSVLPHRPPFLFVDDVVEVQERRIVTRLHVDPESDFFRGHYPHHPIMPGVLICEACFQSGAILLAHRLGGYDPSKGVPVLTRIRDARFKRPVRPGESLDITVELDDELDGAYEMTARATVADRPVVRVTFVCMIAHDAEDDA
ncbi:MAG: beta-hydroxyacyl-ACP dehydratase [Planctomycetota bacterium]|nr:MAG: beta-hydroxyacyl-ACP dehydratase [Planctomycetota bacterium]